MGLRWRLTGVYRWKFYTGAKQNWPKFDGFGGIRLGKLWVSKFRPPRKSNSTETRHPVQNVRRYSQKCVLQSLASKAIKRKERKKNPHLNIIFHPFAWPALRSRLLPFLACGVPTPTQSSVSNFSSIDWGVRGLRVPKIGGFPLTLIVALTTVLRTTVLHCEKSYVMICTKNSYQ